MPAKSAAAQRAANRYAATLDPACFPRAVAYRNLLATDRPALHEHAPRRRAFPYPERHLHCVWHDPGLRPAGLQTRGGEQVTVEHPGLWNREAGPDFLGAVLRIGPARRRLAGDVEIHIHPSDWKAHGHGNDPRYTQVRFHVTYFPGAAQDLDPVPGALHIALKDALARQPGFSFEHIDPSAYPYAARADMPPCSQVLRSFTPEQRTAVLQAAGEERLRRKTERLRDRIEEQGADQTLYEECMAALGYKHNKAPFRHLAALLPFEALQETGGGDPHTAYALLMGAAGLLPHQPRPQWDADTTRWIRSLWDHWWRHRDRFADRGPPPVWRLDGVRPANHPARRLMAAAILFGGPRTWTQQLHTDLQGRPEEWLERTMQHLCRLHDPHLSRRLSLTGQPQPKPVALIGRTRAAAILTNVLIPHLAATGNGRPIVNAILDQLPVEPDNGTIRQTAFYLFGRDHAPALYRPELARQGLIQIFQDFCLNDRSRCAACPLPAALEKAR